MPQRLRADGRRPNELRPIRFALNCLKHPAGSVRVEAGDTHVICTAFVEEGVPDFLEGKGRGWVTAEYGMLPGSTSSRKERGMDGRAYEIRRLIGRCLRTAVDMGRLGERTLMLDCDVLQADGGTRTASVTGAWLALALAVRRLRRDGVIRADPLRRQVAAVSVGVVDGRPMLDLTYQEDSSASVDMNVAMARGAGFVEVQSTAERDPFPAADLDAMLRFAAAGCRRLFRLQREALLRA
jgi:ribonuclease PH